MQILLGFILGAAVGTALHFLVAGRATRGVVLGPVIGAAAAGLAWTILTWSGVGIDSPWPWLAALVAPLVVTWPLLLVLTRTRVAHDESERARLKLV
ncbi:hypothetical protein [Microbacterium sp. SLBN-146]|uniref:hypothetical protein n=1 Tax=Microbacterium sp. SLBN-146 TaxID=2768457 RepID=UPI001151E064|nr:hypothetical protein [Microbacterium sp. SLBN-146]TQJ31765.1 hypothetical protein FBY39_2247 [Microbacterium sp. SLBN-146]